MIRALLVDDEAPARKRLSRLLSSFAEVQVVGEASNGRIALEEIDKLKPDLIFLDIEMPELDGFGVASALGEAGPAVIFVTAYDEFALRAFEVNAVDYLVKPINESRLAACLKKFRNQNINVHRLLEQIHRCRPSQKLAVRSGNRYIVFDPNRVSAILAKDHYSAILVDGRELLADEPLDRLEMKLDPEKFIRVHRSAIVSIDSIRELEREGDRKFSAVLSDPMKTRVPVARERLDEVRSRLGIA